VIAARKTGWARCDHASVTLTQALLIGGRSGVGKTSAAFELHLLLARRGLRHAVIEGDNLDLAYPAPHEAGIPLAEMNLRAVWQNYSSHGYRRLIYTNTAAVRSDCLPALVAAVGGEVQACAVLLTAQDSEVDVRLGLRELGSNLTDAMEQSRVAARQLEEQAVAGVHIVNTAGMSVVDVAQVLDRLAGWGPSGTSC
jgi:hypothetical protein